MSLRKSKSWYSDNCYHFLKRAVHLQRSSPTAMIRPNSQKKLETITAIHFCWKGKVSRAFFEFFLLKLRIYLAESFKWILVRSLKLVLLVSNTLHFKISEIRGLDSRLFEKRKVEAATVAANVISTSKVLR
jgi:hypothetical protein